MAGWTPTDETDWYDMLRNLDPGVHSWCPTAKRQLEKLHVAVACFQCPPRRRQTSRLRSTPCRLRPRMGVSTLLTPVPNASQMRVWNIVLDETRRRLNQRAQIVYWTTIGERNSHQGSAVMCGLGNESRWEHDGNNNSDIAPRPSTHSQYRAELNNLNNWNGGDLRELVVSH